MYVVFLKLGETGAIDGSERGRTQGTFFGGAHPPCEYPCAPYHVVVVIVTVTQRLSWSPEVEEAH